MTKYKTTNHTKYLCQYHIIWCPKFRFNILKKDVKVELKNVLYEISKKYEYEIIEMEIMKDHIHVFVGVKPYVSPIDVVRSFKSISAIKLFKKFSELKEFYAKSGSLWSRGKFISTVGKVSSKTIQRYIKEQNVNS